MTREEAIKLLATEDPVGAAEAVLMSAGCRALLIAGRTARGSGFTLTNHTDRFVRGMVRKAMKDDIAAGDEERRLAAEHESAREDAWFEQRNVPR